MQIVLFVSLAIMISILILLSFYLIIGFSVYNYYLTRNGRMVKKIQKNYKVYLDKINAEPKYFDYFSSIQITSEDGLKLKGFYKDNNSSRLVILVHGFGRDHRELTNIAKMFEKRGYDILSIDNRSHGMSEGKNITMGKEESKDLLLWINKGLELKNNYKIVLFGMSMGASIVCITIGEKLPNNIVLAIEDCGYDNAEKQISYAYSKRKFHSKLIFKIFSSFTKKSMQLDLKSVDAISKLQKSKIPIMFIHGEKDDLVPVEMLYNMSSQIPEYRRKVYLCPEATYTMSSEVNKIQYEKQIFEFLSRFNM